MTGRSVIRQAAAERDIFEYAVYLELKSPQASDRFLHAVEATIARLSSSPGIGQAVEIRGLDYPGLRCGTVDRFKNYVVYYVPIPKGIEVVRVIHGARGDEALLGDDEERPGPL